MTPQMTARQPVSNLRHKYLTEHRILGMIVAGVGLSLSLSGPPAWAQFCPLPAVNPWCTALQPIDCLATAADETCLPWEVFFDVTGQPIILLCDCFSGTGCGPVDIKPNTPAPGYTVSCPGDCPPGQVCELHFNGVPQGQSSIDSSLLPPNTAVTCACVGPSPTLCPLPTTNPECAALQSRDCLLAGTCLPKVIRHNVPPPFFPAAGTDVLTPTTGYVAIRSPSGQMMWYYIRESPPNLTRVVRESPWVEGNHHRIDTEIIAMELVGVAGGGGGGGAVLIRESPTLMSKGRVTGAASMTTDYPADSFFDLFVTIDFPGSEIAGLYNNLPIPLEAHGIRALPPLGSSFKTPQGWPGAELWTPQGPTGYMIVEVVHDLPPPPPEWEVTLCACMDPLGCHVTREPTVDPVCIGGCPTGQECILRIISIDPNMVDYFCECVPREACCIHQPSGPFCMDLPPEQCVPQGVPQGPGTACSATRIACCLPDGSCADVDPLCCDELGGTPSPYAAACLGDSDGNGVDDACEPPCHPQAGGLACSLTICPNPIDTCMPSKVICVGPGICTILECQCQSGVSCHVDLDAQQQPMCVGSCPQGGICEQVYTTQPNQAVIVTCECRPATEACCFVFGDCQNLLPDHCTIIDGTAQGPGTACTQPQACCLPDGTCQDVDPLCCHDLGGTPQGSGTDCTLTACPVAQACCLPNGTCTEVEYNRCVALGGDPQGPNTICDMRYCSPLKWAQPPTYSVAAPGAQCFWGWDDLSDYFSGPIVADDWACSSKQPITDIHWWGSYQNWTTREAPPPGMGPVQFHIGIWTDVPRNVDRPFSHPSKLIWQWTVPRTQLNERYVGCDQYPGRPPDTCFRYDFTIPEAGWFYQAPTTDPTIYWISISALNLGPRQQYPWGWKTREHLFNDDAVRIFAPMAPTPGAEFLDGFPIETPDGVSWDMAFVLTTLSPGPSKWDQWPDVSLPGLHASDGITLADNWECTGGVVTDLHWWGNYELDDQSHEKRGAGIQCINLSIHKNRPDVPWCLPQDPALWGVCALFSALNEHDTGMVNSEGSKIYGYTFYLNPGWSQTPGDIYWLDIEAQSINPANPALWRWQEAGRVPVPRLCPAAQRTPPPPPFMWQSIDWPLQDPTLYSEMAFRITSGPYPPPGNIVWDTDPLSADRTTRSLRFSVTGPPLATAAVPLNAIKVELVELQHPNPRNAVATVALPTQTVPQNFSKFDTASNGVCSGAGSSPNYNGHPCDPSKVPSNADCLCNTPSCPSNDAAHNGVCIGNPAPPLVACTATGETVPPNPSGEGGCARWVGRPATFLEAQEQPTWGHYRAARLQCTPFYYDWVTETAGKVCAGPLTPQSHNGEPCVDNSNCTAPATCIDKKVTVVGAEILPSSTYSVRTYGASCKGREGNCANVSTPVTMFTRRHGDVASVFTPPDVGQPGSTDVAEILRGLNKLGPLRKAGAKIYPNLPEENIDLDVGDLGRVLQAAQGYAYPASESGPCPCPPVHPGTGLPLLCGVTACACDAASGPCVTCGGGQCIRTCIGGENDGLACRDNILSHNHCPGGGTCGSGFCRDKCARCTPP